MYAFKCKTRNQLCLSIVLGEKAIIAKLFFEVTFDIKLL